MDADKEANETALKPKTLMALLSRTHRWCIFTVLHTVFIQLASQEEIQLRPVWHAWVFELV